MTVKLDSRPGFSFLKKKPISGVPQRPALATHFVLQLTQARGEEDPVTKHKGSPRAHYSDLQTLSLAMGVSPGQFPHWRLWYDSSHAHWARFWSLENVVLPKEPSSLGEAVLTALPQSGGLGNPAAASPAPTLCLPFWSVWSGSWASISKAQLAGSSFGGPSMGESSLEPLVRAPIVLGELPTPSYRSGVWGHKCDVWTSGISSGTAGQWTTGLRIAHLIQ